MKLLDGRLRHLFGVILVTLFAIEQAGSVDYAPPPELLYNAIKDEVVFAAILKKSDKGPVFHRVIRGDKSLTNKINSPKLFSMDILKTRFPNVDYFVVIFGRDPEHLSAEIKLSDKVSCQANWEITGWTNSKGILAANFKGGRWELTLSKLFGGSGKLHEEDRF